MTMDYLNIEWKQLRITITHYSDPTLPILHICALLKVNYCNNNPDKYIK